MTLPDERYRSVVQAYRLLKDLCDPSVTPRVSSTIRNRASGVLRHFPSEYDLDVAAEHAPHVFVKELDPLYKMVVSYAAADIVEEDLKAQGLIKDPQGNPIK